MDVNSPGADLAENQIVEPPTFGIEGYGIELKPIRLRRSLYLLIPMDIAKLIGVVDKTKFVLTLEHGNESVLTYHKVETSPS